MFSPNEDVGNHGGIALASHRVREVESSLIDGIQMSVTIATGAAAVAAVVA